jgi:inhibitor of cysteine peptidase
VPAVSYGAKDAGKTVTVAVGARFSVELEENPTTGYKWSSPEFDAKVLALTGDEYAPAEGAAIGGGGKRTFGFVARAAGRAAIRLAYRRPWERDVVPEASFDMTVVVTP